EWEDLAEEEWRARLEEALQPYVKRRPWFRGKDRELKNLQIRDAIRMVTDAGPSLLLFLRTEYIQGEPEEYLLPVAAAAAEEDAQVETSMPQHIIARVLPEGRSSPLVLYEATRCKSFCRAVLETVLRRRTLDGSDGELKGTATPALRHTAASLLRSGRTEGRAGESGSASGVQALEPILSHTEHSNGTVVFGDQFFLKLFRRLEQGVNPELEIGRVLTKSGLATIPPVVGWLEYRRPTGETFTAGILTKFLPHGHDAWAYTIDMLSRYFERAHTAPTETKLEPLAQGSLLDLAGRDAPETVVALIGTYIEMARLLGQRSAELHLALTSDDEHRDFAPEPFTPFYQRSLYQSMRNLAVQIFQRLRSETGHLPVETTAVVSKVIGLENEILKRVRRICDAPIDAKRMRCHGDFHLGQVLFTG
ncbi:MAG: maltokinase N-terminal cap-like domain-containing protein, partial [Limisphaerales bacterium]